MHIHLMSLPRFRKRIQINSTSYYIMKFNSKSVNENSFTADRFNIPPETFYSGGTDPSCIRKGEHNLSFITQDIIRQNLLACQRLSECKNKTILKIHGKKLRGDTTSMHLIRKLTKRLLYSNTIFQ